MFTFPGTPSCRKLVPTVITLLLFLVLVYLLIRSPKHSTQPTLLYHSISDLRQPTLQSLTNFLTPAIINQSSLWMRNCHFHTCFNISRCVHTVNDLIGVYVYPRQRYQYVEPVSGTEAKTVVYDPPFSQEYEELLTAVVNSDYYQPNSSLACVFIPSLDTLNEQLINASVYSGALHSLTQ